MSVLTGLPLFEEAHIMGVVFEGAEKKKLDFLNRALTNSSVLKQGHLSAIYSKF